MPSETDELARRAEAIYEQRLRALLEPAHRGMFVAIEPDSGDHFLGKSVIEAMTAAEQAHPGRKTYVLRVGYRAANELARRIYCPGRQVCKAARPDPKADRLVP